MPPRREFAVPTNAPYPHTHRLPSSSLVARALSKLSRSSLISLALDWVSPENVALCHPVLAADATTDDDTAPYTAVESLDHLRDVYQELANRKGGKKEVVDRILEGDWRHGLTLYQYAMIETRYLLDHPASLRWNALRITPSSPSGDQDSDKEMDAADLPRIHAQTLLARLEKELAPLTKAHYFLTRIKTMRATLLRLLLHDSPYTTQKSLQALHTVKSGASDEPKSLYLLFPDGTPYIHVSMASGGGQDSGFEGRGLKAIILESVATCLSKPGARYTLKATNLSVKSLDALLALRGGGRTSSAQGGWSIFVDNSCGTRSLDYRPVPTEKAPGRPVKSSGIKETNSTASSRRSADHLGEDAGVGLTSSAKRRQTLARNRFGNSGNVNDGAAIDRLDVRISDEFPALPSIDSNGRVRDDRPGDPSSVSSGADAELERAWTPSVRLTFHGTHIFAGVRALVEQGKIDGERMPGWMTGEAGVSIGIVRNGKLAQN